MANKADTVIANIIKGAYDGDLDAIRDAIRARNGVAEQGLFHELNVGDLVVIKNCNPKYLIGRQATVVRKLQKRVVIDLEEPAGKWHRGIRIQMSMLEKAA